MPRFVIRWWTATWGSLGLGVLGLGAALGAFGLWPLAAVTGLVGLVAPLGLSVRGRTSPLVWTHRLQRLAIASGTLLVAVGVGAAFTPAPFAIGALAVLLCDVAVELAVIVLSPVESRLAEPWVRRARRRLAQVAPRIVAITGSYGKTSTKHHLAELLSGTTTVVPTPRSFNNRAGLATAVNTNLVDGTKVFIAEMGTYGPGEIRAMCTWCPPDVAVLTAIGPVHLERFGTIERIVESKAEITERASHVVLNVDDARLAALAERLRGAGTDVVTAGSDRDDVDVQVAVDGERWHVHVHGELLARMTPIPGVQPTNLACALGAAVALGTDPAALVERVGHVAPVPHRLTVATAPSGVLVVDDTYNSNPAGAGAALELLGTLPAEHQRVVVTPGMVELGTRQRTENEAFAGAASRVASTIVVVGRTNAVALAKGATAGGAAVRRVATRERAVEWVRATLGPGDAVLYENDLPDHYP